MPGSNIRVPQGIGASVTASLIIMSRGHRVYLARAIRCTRPYSSCYQFFFFFFMKLCTPLKMEEKRKSSGVRLLMRGAFADRSALPVRIESFGRRRATRLAGAT